MPDKDKKTPEWSIFDRLDDLETNTLKIMDKQDSSEPTLERVKEQARDAYVMSIFALNIGFQLVAIEQPASARRYKDTLLKGIETAGVSQSTRAGLKTFFLEFCDALDKASSPTER